MEINHRRRALFALAAAPVGLAACASAEGAGMGHHGHEQHMAEMQARLDRMETRAAVTEVLHKYARSMDRADEALMRECFWPESTHKHGRFEGLSHDFLTSAIRIVSNLKFAAHHISNVSVEQRGDRAFSECYYLAHHRRNVQGSTEQEEDAFFEGRYLDFFERREGVWKIIRRRGQSDFTAAAIPANTLYANWPAGQHSLKAPEDEYYIMRQNFLSGG